MNSTEGFANAELSRRLKCLFLSGSINQKNEDGTVNVSVATGGGELYCPNTPLLNRTIDNVSVGNPILLISPEGSLEAGVVLVIGENPEVKRLREQVSHLEQRFNNHDH